MRSVALVTPCDGRHTADAFIAVTIFERCVHLVGHKSSLYRYTKSTHHASSVQVINSGAAPYGSYGGEWSSKDFPTSFRTLSWTSDISSFNSPTTCNQTMIL